MISFSPDILRFGWLTINMGWWTVFRDTATVVVAATVGGTAVFVYRRNISTKRAEFICQLHKSFFEEEKYKEIRKAFDKDNEADIATFVESEPQGFIEFLNFFELVAYLEDKGNLDFKDVDALLGYYLVLLRKYPALRQYIRDRENSFEELDRLLAIMEQRKSRRS